MSTWPKRPDGSNKTIGEMTPEERKEQIRLAAIRVAQGFSKPESADAFAKFDHAELKKEFEK